MKYVNFGNTFSRVKPLILWVVLIQVLFPLASGSIFLIWGKPLLVVIEILAAIALIIFLLTVAFLWFIYLRQPEVKDQYQLKKQIQRIEVEMAGAQSSLSEIQNNKETIQNQSQQQQSVEKNKFENLKQSFQEELQHLITAKEQEITSALAGLQKTYIEEGLQKIPLDPALVPGIGDLLTEKLISNGINTALDVSRDTIQNIPGFGEAKSLSLYRWRESEENKLIATQPSCLPPDEQAAIEQKYDRLIRDKENEAELAQSTYATAMQAIITRESGELTELAEAEDSSKLKVTSLVAQKEKLQNQFAGYQSITFMRMLFNALNSGKTRWINRAGSIALQILFFLLGLINLLILIAAWSFRKS